MDVNKAVELLAGDGACWVRTPRRVVREAVRLAARVPLLGNQNVAVSFQARVEVSPREGDYTREDWGEIVITGGTYVQVVVEFEGERIYSQDIPARVLLEEALNIIREECRA